jgi:hypothetical protein
MDTQEVMKHLAALFQPMPAVVSPTEIRVQQSKEQEQPTREGSAKKINRSHHQSYILSENRIQIREANLQFNASMNTMVGYSRSQALIDAVLAYACMRATPAGF